jgi:thiol-disulfide isomerase/thioredoxin
MPEHSVWNGTLELDEGKLLPFRFSLDLRPGMPTGFFLVGEEQTPIPEISRNGDELAFRFSEYGAEMRGTWDGSGWNGAYLRHRSSGIKSFKFTASPETAPAREVESLTNAAPSGKYQVSFQDEKRSTTMATLATKGATTYGTFIAPDGDYGLLVGKPTGESVQLNRFTGWQATVVVLEQRGGTWSGKLYTHSDKPRAFTLEPRADLEFAAPPDLQTRIKNPAAGFTFEGVSITGAAVRNTDERFKGKALVVDIMGTWCHNCLDGAPLLQQLQDQYGSKGLQVVGLSFEISDDRELGQKNLKLYQERFGITFPLLFCGSIDDANVNNRLKTQLDNFFAYPTTLFINKEGKVHAVHSGFKGPGTGEEFQAQVQEFHDLAKQLVN